MIRATMCAALVSLLAAAGWGSASGPTSVMNTARLQEQQLTGTWILNHEESDDPQEQLEEMRQGAGGGRGMRGGRRPDMGGRQGGMSGRRGGQGREGRRQAMQMILEPDEQFTITQSDSTITFQYANERELLLFPDGRKTTHELEDGGRLEARTKWEKERLIVERKFEAGKLVEEYFLAAEGEQLYVVVRAELGRGGTLEFRRIYDPMP